MHRALPLPAIGALTVIYLVWGSTYVATRIVVGVAPPLESMGIRFLLAGLLMLAWAVFTGGLRRLSIRRREILGIVGMALALLAVNNGSVSMATRAGVPSGVAALLLAMVSVWLVLLRAVAGDRPSSLTVMGTVGGCVGTGALIAVGSGAGRWPLGGVLVLVGASICWALGLWLRPTVRLPDDKTVSTAYQMVAAGGALLIMAGVNREPIDLNYGLHIWMAIAYLVVAVSIVGYTCYCYLIDTIPVSIVATHAYVNPVVALVLGWALLSESLSGRILVAGLVVVLSSVLVIYGERNRTS